MTSPPGKVHRFECQQSGHCCCDPNIIVTLTFLDVYAIYLALDKDFESLMKKLSFLTFEKQVNEDQKKKLVLPVIFTSDGEILPVLKKINEENCTFYSKPNCGIYHNRPLACRNYPFTFLHKSNKIILSWAKNAEETCIGIGQGTRIDNASIRRLGKKTSSDLIKHANLIRELNSEAEKGKPLTVREVIWILIVYGEKINYEK